MIALSKCHSDLTPVLFEPNWLCSGHGGAWGYIAISTILISFPVFIYLLLFKGIKNSE